MMPSIQSLRDYSGTDRYSVAEFPERSEGSIEATFEKEILKYSHVDSIRPDFPEEEEVQD